MHQGVHDRKIPGDKKGISMARKEIVKIINKFASALGREGINIEKIILYGSYANGKTRPESDIDVAVVSKDFGKDKTEEGMFLFKIAGDIDSRLEPVPLSLQSYRKNTWVPLIYEIRKSGIEIDIKK